MKILTSLIIFFVAIIALVSEIILYFIVAMGAGLSGGSIAGIAAFFVSLFIFTAATAILAPICAIVELIVIKYVDIKRKKRKKHHKLVELFYKDTGSFLLITSLSVLLLLLILFMSFAVSNQELDVPLQETSNEKPTIPEPTGKFYEQTSNGVTLRVTGYDFEKKSDVYGKLNTIDLIIYNKGSKNIFPTLLIYIIDEKNDGIFTVQKEVPLNEWFEEGELLQKTIVIDSGVGGINNPKQMGVYVVEYGKVITSVKFDTNLVTGFE